MFPVFDPRLSFVPSFLGTPPPDHKKERKGGKKTWNGFADKPILPRWQSTKPGRRQPLDVGDRWVIASYQDWWPEGLDR